MTSSDECDYARPDRDAVVLARSFVVKRPAAVFRELKSLGVWDFHITRGARDLLLSWLVQAIEARTGAAILGVGFVLQGVSQLLAPAQLAAGPWVLVVVVGLSVGAFFVLQSFFVRFAAGQADDFYKVLLSEARSDDWKGAIPARRKELRAIQENPSLWLNPSEEDSPGVDTTLTSNEDPK